MSRPAEPSLQDVARTLRAETAAAWAWINVVDGEDILTVAGDGAGHQRLTGRRTPLDGSLTARVATSGHDVVVLNDTFDSATSWEMRTRVIRAGLGPCAMAVMRDGDGRLVGSVSVGRRTGDRPFPDGTGETVAQAAAQALPLLPAR